MPVEAKSEDTQTGESVVSVEESTIKASEKKVDVAVEEPTTKDAEKKLDVAVEETTTKDAEEKVDISVAIEEPTIKDVEMKIGDSVEEHTIKVEEKKGASVEEPIIKAEESTIKDVEKKVDSSVVGVVAEGNVEEKKEEEPKTREVVVEEEKKKDEGGDENGDLLVSSSPVIEKSSSFKEETELEQSDLKENEKKALIEFKSKLEEAILQNKLFKKKEEGEQKEKEQQKENEKSKEGGGDKEKEQSTEEVGNEEKEKSKEEDGEKEKEKPNEERVEEKEEKIVKEEGIEEKQKSSSAEAEEKEKEKVERESEEEKNPDVGTKGKSVEEDVVVVDKDISIWGVPLLPSKDSEATDEILLKFLRARDFKVNEAFEMLKNTLQWRKDKKIDSILEEDLGLDLTSVAYMDGLDFEGHPICYNMYGIFEDDQLYQKSFGTEEKREQFLRWRVQLMEKGIQKLDFKKGGISSLLQINDLKNSPGPSRKELRIAMKQAVNLLQDNYPEFVARNIFVNVPFWYYAFNAVLSPFLTQRTRSKFVFARPAKVTETLLRYIPAEQIPIRYGGMKRDNDSEFSTEEIAVTELTVKSGSTETIEIPAPEIGSTLLWDLTVLGWEVNYKEEFVPADEGSYTIIVQKGKKMGYNEEPVRNSFRNNEPGKIVLTVENGSFKKKRILYRYKTKNSSSSSY